MVARGQSPTQVLTIDRINAAGLEVRAHGFGEPGDQCPARADRAGRDSSASYALTVSLKPDAPAGLVRDEIRLISNDAETAEHPAHGDGLDSGRPDGRTVGPVAGPDSFGRGRGGPVRRPLVATVHHPVRSKEPATAFRPRPPMRSPSRRTS